MKKARCRGGRWPAGEVDEDAGTDHSGGNWRSRAVEMGGVNTRRKRSAVDS